MPTKILDKTISGGRRFLRVNAFKDLAVRRCSFVAAHFGFNRGLSGRRDSLTNSQISDCTVNRCSVQQAVLNDLVVHNIEGDVLFFRMTRFRHVKLTGRILSLVIHGPRTSGAIGKNANEVKLFNDFYANTDWALDIRDAELDDLTIRGGGIPLNLVRRDVETQFIVNVADVYAANLEKRLSSYGEVCLRLALESGDSEFLFVAPKQDRKTFDEVLEDAVLLRSKGCLR